VSKIVFSWPSDSPVRIKSDSLGTRLIVENPKQQCTIQMPQGSSISVENGHDSFTFYIYEQQTHE
jgi:hypothetical protein